MRCQLILALTYLGLVASDNLKAVEQVVEPLATPEVLTPDKIDKLAPQGDGTPKGTKQPDPSAGTVNTRIIGGTVATPGQFPWQAALLIDGSSFCGGSLIDLRWVMTAAHCIPTKGGRSRIEVTLGMTDRSNLQDGRVTVTTTSSMFFVHSGYNNRISLANDIALIQLPSSVVITANIRPISLPRASDSTKSFEGTMATVSGWGKTSDGGSISQTLMSVNLVVVKNSICAQSYGTNNVVDSSLCLATNGGSQSACNGDSGGPLVYPESTQMYVQIGIVSFGSSLGCQSGLPNVFTRVSSFLSWISLKTNLAIRN